MIYQIKQGQLVEFDSGYVEYLISNYIPDDSIVIPNAELPYDIDYCQLAELINPHPASTIIFDCSGDPIDVEHRLEQIASAGFTKPFYILSGLFKYYKNPAIDSRIRFFPFWCVWMSKPYAPLLSLGPHTFSHATKQYTVSCLNGTYWNHRILTYLYLSEQPYFKDILFSFGLRPRFEDLVNECTLMVEEHDRFSKLPHPIQLENDTDQIDVTVNHPAYINSYINLVTETNVRVSTPMLSEKSFKPIVAGQLFVLIAAPGAVQFLQDIGIDTFDDIIDHSYDAVVDHRLRIRQAIDQISHLVSLDQKELYDRIKPRLERNSEYFRSEEFRQQFWLNFS